MANQFITAKLKGVKEALDLYDKNLVRKAARSALDGTGTWIKQYIVRSVSSMYYILPAIVRRAIEVKRTSMSSLSVLVIIKGFRLNLFKFFHPFRSGSGVSVNVSKINTWHYDKAFIQTARQGNNPGWRGVMKRTGKFLYRRPPPQGLKQKKLQEGISSAKVHGPAIPDLVGGPKIYADLETKAGIELEKKFWEQIDKRITIK